MHEVFTLQEIWDDAWARLLMLLGLVLVVIWFAMLSNYEMRFTLRDVFWIVVVIALLLGWGVDHQALVNRERIERQKALSHISSPPMPDLAPVRSLNPNDPNAVR